MAQMLEVAHKFVKAIHVAGEAHSLGHWHVKHIYREHILL